ncbi:MAG: hypothetical protein QM765_30680 [Myxococcales bacterium]
MTAFGALLRGSPLRHLNPRVYRQADRGLRELMESMEEAEASHTITFAIVGLYSATAAHRGWWPAFAALCVLNLVANLYPILHLRHCRARLAAVTARRPGPMSVVSSSFQVEMQVGCPRAPMPCLLRPSRRSATSGPT